MVQGYMEVSGNRNRGRRALTIVYDFSQELAVLLKEVVEFLMGSKFGYQSIYWGAGVWGEIIRIYTYIHFSKKENYA